MIKMKPLLKESTWKDRKWGDPLPTLKDYMSETYDDENCGDGHAVVSEADDDDKYVSIGWGKYKEKGKEDDENAPSFTKTDSGKFVKSGGDKKDKGDKPKKKGKALGKGDFGRDLDDDPTRGDPDDAWDDEEGRAKPPIGWKPTRPSYTPSGEPASIGVDPDDPDAPAPKGGTTKYKTGKGHPKGGTRYMDTGDDFTKSADYDMWSGDDEDDYDMGEPDRVPNQDFSSDETDDDYSVYTDPEIATLPDPDYDHETGEFTGDDEYALSGDDDAQQKGMDKARDLAKKGMKKRPGGKKAEEDYMKADQMMAKYAGVDIEKAEFWAKKKRQAADAMMGEITINGKKYKPITESINPTVFDPGKEIKKQVKRINLRQFDRKWKKEII